MFPESDVMVAPVTPIADVVPAPTPFATKNIASKVPVPVLVILLEMVMKEAAWSVNVFDVVQVIGEVTVMLPVLAPGEPTVEMRTLHEPFSSELSCVLRI